LKEKQSTLSQIANPAEVPLALLCGGDSTERNISLASGAGALAALQEAGFAVTVFDPAEEEAMRQLQKAAAEGSIKAAFLCVHGKNGEDGVLQAKLEAMGLPYTGSGVEASKRAINKATSKDVYAQAGLLTPQGIALTKNEHSAFAGKNGFDYDAIAARVGNHCVVKASQGGSTIGIYMVEKPEDLPAAIEAAFEYDDEVIVESYIAGKEYTVAVIGNDEVQALPIIEIVPQNGFYDFEAKYTPGGSTHICPAPLSDALTAHLKECACTAHKALGCKGMSRSDFIIDQAGDAWILETNTIPGMTKTSLLPDAAAVAGIPFSELCSYFVSLALED